MNTRATTTALCAAGLLAAALYAFYFTRFQLPLDQEKLAQLGDFIGGNLNPALTFISIIILIKTISLQSIATDLAKESQNLAARETELSRKETEKAHQTIKEQGKLTAIQIFESSFFNLIKLGIDEYTSAEIHTKKSTLKGSKAFEAFEKKFLLLKKSGKNPTSTLEALDDHHGNICYEILKTFSVIFKIIEENAPYDLKEKYTSIALSLTPTKIIYLLCIAENHSTWGILKPYRTCKIFEKKGIKELIHGYK